MSSHCFGAGTQMYDRFLGGSDWRLWSQHLLVDNKPDTESSQNRLLTKSLNNAPPAQEKRHVPPLPCSTSSVMLEHIVLPHMSITILLHNCSCVALRLMNPLKLGFGMLGCQFFLIFFLPTWKFKPLLFSGVQLLSSFWLHPSSFCETLHQNGEKQRLNQTRKMQPQFKVFLWWREDRKDSG